VHVFIDPVGFHKLGDTRLIRDGRGQKGTAPGCKVWSAVAACYDPPMARGARDLLTEVLELPLDERAKIAAELLESLEDAEGEVEEAWASEIQKRVAAARAGELASTDWRMVLERVEREVLGR
jgi:hypothetical protein